MKRICKVFAGDEIDYDSCNKVVLKILMDTYGGNESGQEQIL